MQFERLVHRDEPLFGGAENDSRFAPPIMRIAVGDDLLGEEQVLFAQPFNDFLISFIV